MSDSGLETRFARLANPVDDGDWEEVCERAAGLRQNTSARAANRSRFPARRVALVAAAVVFAFTAGSAVALERLGPRDWFSVFTSPLLPGESNDEQSGIPARLGLELGETRVVATDLGRFRSRLLVSTAADGRAICYELHGRTARDPGMSYCWHPDDPTLPAPLVGQHFHVIGVYGGVEEIRGWQVFGVAFDDVVRIRVNVAGRWINAPIMRNGFYLDLPDAEYGDVGIVEATLADGSKQLHDLQKGG